jgi:ketosteroid isomerase-like protein
MTRREHSVTTHLSPSETVEAFAAHLNDGDLDAAMSHYEPGAVFHPAAEGPPVAGTEAIREALTDFVALNPVMEGEIAKVSEAGDTALVINRWRLRGTQPNGSPVELAGTSADVLHRGADGAWRILIDDPWGGG